MSDLSTDFLQQLDSLPPEAVPEVNFFTAGGSGYLENPTSDLLALFMGENAGVPPWLLNALLHCLNIGNEGDALDTTSLEVSREVITEDGKFLDLLIYHQDFIIGIEHKTFSAINNPFASYQQLLESCVDNGQPIYTCIVKPDANRCPPQAGWPFINYSTLVDAARNRLGHDQARLPFSKWHVFYTEFLNHLYALSGKEPEQIMNNDKQTFVTENFQQLLKANALLAEFEAAMIETAKLTMAEVFPDKNCRHRVNNWEGDYKAIHLYPEGWGNETSWVTLVYYPAENGQTMKFYVNGIVNVADCPELVTLHQAIEENKHSALFLPAANKDDEQILLSRSGKELTISFGTPNGTLEEGRQLLKEMALFIEGALTENAFVVELPR